MTTIPHILVAVLGLLGAFSGQASGAQPAIPATAPATSAAPATTPTGLYVASSLALVFERIEIWPGGTVAVFVEYRPDGSKSYRYLKEGSSSTWISQSGLEIVKVLEFGGDHVRVSRSPFIPDETRPPVVVEPRVMDVKIGFDLDGRPAPPQLPPPLNPALLALGAEELFTKCQAATGTDYAEAKAVLVSRPKEAAALAKKALDNKDAPWQDRLLAQALTEEIADPKAYAAARMELLRLACVTTGFPQRGEGGYIVRSREGVRDPRVVYDVDSVILYKRLATYSGLKGEIILKATADQLWPLVAEAISQDRERQYVEYMKAWEADQAGPKKFGSFYPPFPVTPQQVMKEAQPGRPATMFRIVRSVAARACAHAPDTYTRPLLNTLDPQQYAAVLADCNRILQEAATKPATASQPATAPGQ